MPRLRYFVNLQEPANRIRVDFETQYGQVITIYVVQYEISVDGNWQPVARYDCAHGFFHRDIYTRRGVIKYRVFIQDLGQALTFAVQDLKSNWQHYRRLFEGGQL
jgi:hypothetical protein